jgi:hypothetical protein
MVLLVPEYPALNLGHDKAATPTNTNKLDMTALDI